MPKQMDEALLYAESVEHVGQDPMSGETETDKLLRESSSKHSANMRALKELSTKDWAKIGVTPTPTPRKRKVTR